MKKNVIALAVLAAMAAPLAVQAQPTVYGKVHVSLDSNNVENAAGDTTKDNFELKSRASRVGVKGSEDLGNGLKAVYGLEWQVDVADTGNLSARNQFVGLAGGFGTVLAGRHDTPMKISTGKLDFFADESGDYNSTVGFVDVRAPNAIAYISPNMTGLTIAAAVVPGEGAGADNAALTDYANDANGLADVTSIALMYSAGPLYLSAAHEAASSDALDQADDGYTQIRLGAGYSVAGVDLALVYETQDTGTDDGVGDRALTQVSARYNMGANAIKAMYGMADDWSEIDESGHTTYAVGFDHKFSKSTKAYAQYTAVDSDDFGGNDSTVLSFGMVTSF